MVAFGYNAGLKKAIKAPSPVPPLNSTPNEGNAFQAFLQENRSKTYFKAVNSMSKSNNVYQQTSANSKSSKPKRYAALRS